MNFLADLSSKDTLTLLLFLIIAFLLGVLTWYLCRTKPNTSHFVDKQENAELTSLRSEYSLLEKKMHTLRNENQIVEASLQNLKKVKSTDATKESMSVSLDTDKITEEGQIKLKLQAGEIESLKAKIADSLNANERMKADLNKANSSAQQFESDAKLKAEIENKFEKQANEIISWKVKYDDQVAAYNKLKSNTPERPNVLAEIQNLKIENDRLTTEAANHFALKSRLINLENENIELKNKAHKSIINPGVASLAPVPMRNTETPATQDATAPVVLDTTDATAIAAAPLASQSPTKVVPDVTVSTPSMALPKGIKQDDLKLVEGIGPKIESVLQAGGIATWLQLSQTSPEKISEVLLAADDKYRIHDPGTWPEQAKLLAEAKWEEFELLTQSLKGGRKKS